MADVIDIRQSREEMLQSIKQIRRVIHSFYDKNEMLYVDCTECERGINGGDKDKCSAGWKQKRPGLGCFCGKLIKDITPGKWKP